MKMIEVLIKIPGEWVDPSSPTLMLPEVIRQRLEPMLRNEVIKKAVDQIKLPPIEITPEEVKDRMLSLLAQRALEDNV